MANLLTRVNDSSMIARMKHVIKGFNVATEMQHYYYEVKDFYFILEGGEKLVIKPNDLISYTVMNDYVYNLFPIIQVKISMDSTTYYKIIASKNIVNVWLSIYKYTRKSGELEKRNQSIYIKKKFTLILNDADPDLSADVRKVNHADTENISEELYEKANIVEFFLFRSDLLKKSKKKVNRIFEKATATDGIVYVAKKMGLKDLIMSPADNAEEYEPLIIPPLKVTDAIKYIDTFYGLYKTGMMMYFGVDTSYIIKYEGACTAYRPNELTEVMIIVPKAGTEAAQELCSVNKGYGCFLIGDYRTITFENRDVSGDLLNGQDIHIVNANQEETSGMAPDTNKKIIVNRGFNKWLQGIFNKQKNSTKVVITVEFSDVDLSVFEPNKVFKFSFEDSVLQDNYKGNFILVKSEIMLARSEADMNAVAKCTFMKG